MSDRILIDPAIQHGKPVILHTRVPVARIVGGLAGGVSFEEIEKEYGVTADDIRAALEFANEDRSSKRPTLGGLFGVANPMGRQFTDEEMN